MRRAAAAVIGPHCRGRQPLSRSATVLAAPLVLPATEAQAFAAFSAFSRARRSPSRNRSSSRSSTKSAPPPPPPPPPPPAAPARPRPKHAAPYPVTLDEIRAYHDKQSFFSRLARLRLRLHHTFQLILATHRTAAGTPARPSSAVQRALDATTRIFRTFAPFEPPFPRTLYHHFLCLHAATTPSTAHTLLARGLSAGLVGDDSVAAVAAGYARLGDGAAVRELMGGLRDRGERVTVRMYEALLEAVGGDGAQLREVRDEMRQQGVKLSDKCWLLMLPAYKSQAGTTDLRRLLADLSTEQAPISPDLAHAIANSQPDMTTLQSAAGAAALAASVLPHMEYLLSHPSAASPEQVHHLLRSTPSLHKSSRAWSTVLRAYARREHVHTGSVAGYDALVIEKLLADMATQGVAEDEWALQVRMILAAQRGAGDEVLALMERTVETLHPPPSLFLPVLRTVASLRRPERLPILHSLHSYLQRQRLTSQFSWSVVLSLQSSLGDIAGVRSTLAAMKAASVPLTIHHWHQLLLSSPNTTQTALLRDMMKKLHVLPSAYTEAIVLSKQPTLRDAEHYYASLLDDAVSPHPLVRLAMADVYGSVGYVRWAARQWWKVVSGQAERVTKAEEESRDEWAVLGDVSEEEMDRMLVRLHKADVGSRQDLRELRRLLQVERETRQRREADQVEQYRQLLGLDVQLSAEQRQAEAQRVAQLHEDMQAAPLLRLRMQAQQARLEAGLQEDVLQMADSTLVKRFGDHMRRIKARVAYAHMDILEQWEAKAEHEQQQGAAAGRAWKDEQDQASWLRDAEEFEEKRAEKEEEKVVFVDLDEDVREKSSKKSTVKAARPVAGERDVGSKAERKRAAPITPPRPVELDEDWAMMEAARQLVASRRPKETDGI